MRVVGVEHVRHRRSDSSVLEGKGEKVAKQEHYPVEMYMRVLL